MSIGMDPLPEHNGHFAANVRDWGARGDGCAPETRALQAALDACSAGGGGTVFVPAGCYVTGALALHSDITLYLDAGAVLLGSEDPADYPVSPGRWEGAEQLVHAPLIGGRDLRNVAIAGRGTIDGRGAYWWRAFQAGTLRHPRPRLIAFDRCTNVLVEGITAVNSPAWTIHPVHCDNVTVTRVTVVNPPDSPNTDGINPDSCRGVRISDCYVSAGDDCIAIKSGARPADQASAPCRDIAITNCTLARGHGGIVIGSETSGGVSNVVISNCVFTGTDRGIRLKSRRGRGGVVEDIRISNVVMTGVMCPLAVNLYYACGAWGDPVVADRHPRLIDAGTPRFRRIHLSQVTARDVRVAAGFLHGLAEMPLEDVTLDDVAVSMAAEATPDYPEMADGLEPMQRAGFYAGNVRGLRLHRVEVTGQDGSALCVADAAGLEISASTFAAPSSGGPAVHLRNVIGAFVIGCRATPGTEVFLQVEGERTSEVVLNGNYLARARRPLVLSGGARAEAVLLHGSFPQELPL